LRRKSPTMGRNREVTDELVKMVSSRGTLLRAGEEKTGGDNDDLTKKFPRTRCNRKYPEGHPARRLGMGANVLVKGKRQREESGSKEP